MILAAVAIMFVVGDVRTSVAQGAQAKKPAPSSTSALGENVVYARLGQFFKLLSEAKIKEGYEALTKGSELITNIDTLVVKTKDVIKRNGEVEEAELLRTTRVGKRLLRIAYLTHGGLLPVQWDFYCYRSNSGWQVVDITVNNDLYDIFDKEEKAQQRAKEAALK